MLKTTQFHVQCAQCGNAEFLWPEHPQDDDFIKCNFCGYEVLLADLKQIGVEQVKAAVLPELKAEVMSALKKSLKGLK